MEPASTIIDRMGGIKRVAEITGVHRTRVSNWKRPREVGGTGGVIPLKHIPVLIAEARSRGIVISADDFMPTSE